MKDLDGDMPRMLRLLGQVDGRHPAIPQGPFDHIAPGEYVAGLKGGWQREGRGHDSPTRGREESCGATLIIRPSRGHRKARRRSFSYHTEWHNGLPRMTGTPGSAPFPS